MKPIVKPSALRKGDAVGVGPEGAQPVAYGRRFHAEGAGQRGGGQRVGDVVRGGRVDVGDA